MKKSKSFSKYKLSDLNYINNNHNNNLYIDYIQSSKKSYVQLHGNKQRYYYQNYINNKTNNTNFNKYNNKLNLNNNNNFNFNNNVTNSGFNTAKSAKINYLNKNMNYMVLLIQSQNLFLE